MASGTGQSASRDRFPVSVLMARHVVSRGVWSIPQWRALAVLPGEEFAEDPAGNAGAPVRVHNAGGEEQYLWRGFTLRLYRDGAESYWYNLVGRQPSLFVLCRAGEEGELAPFLVTANYDEAGAYLEADDEMFSVPLPPEVHVALEQFVMEHYVPREPEKRKRKNWVQDDERKAER